MIRALFRKISSKIVQILSGYRYYGNELTAKEDTIWTSTNTINTVAYGNGVYLGVGGSGHIAYSTDGKTWVKSDNLSNTDWGTSNITDIVFFNNKFVAVGYSGKLATSSDGVNWVYSTDLLNSSWGNRTVATIEVGPTGVVVGGTSGYVAFSSNLITWTTTSLASTSFGANHVIRVRYCKGYWYILGNTGRISRSTNGTTWTYCTQLTATNNITDMATDGTTLVLCSSNSKIYTSTDGLTWTARTSINSTSWGKVAQNSLVYANGIYVLIGFRKTAISTDGITWTNVAAIGTNATTYPLSIKFLNGLFIASGRNGEIMWSVNGTTWNYSTDGLTKTRTYWITEPVNGFFKNPIGNNYIAFGGSTKISYSDDLVNWVLNNTFNFGGTYSDITSICYGNGKFLLVGSTNRFIGISSDGVNWTQTNILSSTMRYSGGYKVVFLNNYFIILGGAGRVYVSLDPTSSSSSWINGSSLGSTKWGTSSAVKDILYKDGEYYVVGATGHVAKTTNFTSWTYIGGIRSTAWGSVDANGIAYGNGKFVVVGNSGMVATSINGTTWTNYTNLRSGSWSTANINAIKFINGLFYIVGNSGKFASSVDGITWTLLTDLSLTTNWSTKNINGFDYVDGMFYFWGSSGAIATYIP